MTELKHIPEAIKLGRLKREHEVPLEATEETKNKRRVQLCFSSEEPYERGFGIEVLGHEPGEIDLEWLNSGRAPLLFGHNTSDLPIGIVESATLDSDRKGRAVVRFGSSPRAEDVLKAVEEGTCVNVSVGYEIKELRLEEERNGCAVYRATSWKPLEISVVSVPADTTVGFGREAESGPRDVLVKQKKENPVMPDNTPVTESTTIPATVHSAESETRALEDALKRQRADTAEIFSLARHFNMHDEGQKAIANGTSVDAFRKHILEAQRSKLDTMSTPNRDLDMEKKEVQRYSLCRAINAASTGDWSGAGLERNASLEIARRSGSSPRGFFVPNDVFKRDLNVGTATAGGHLVGTELMSGSFIGLLHSKMMVKALGATVLAGLRENIDLPKQSTGGLHYWLSEGEDVTKSDIGFGKVPMTPRTVAAKYAVTRKLIQQSSLDVEAMMQDDIIRTLALAIDAACLTGTGQDGQPRGILHNSDVTVIAAGTNGGAPTFKHMVALETAISQKNAEEKNMAYLTNSSVRGELKTSEKAPGTAQFVWLNGEEPGFGMVNGRRAAVSNQVPNTLTKGTAKDKCSMVIFGNWADLTIGHWGILDLQVDPFAAGDSGGLVVRAFQDVDIAIRRPESFAIMKDVLTS